MERRRASSFSSDTLSSISSSTSRSSTATYASIKSYTLRISTSVKAGDFWVQFDRTSSLKRRTLGKVIKDIFTPKQKSEPKKHISIPLLEKDKSNVFSDDLNISTCPPGLYCVIDEFLTEYDLRLLEEEKRADMLAKKSKTSK